MAAPTRMGAITSAGSGPSLALPKAFTLSGIP